MSNEFIIKAVEEKLDSLAFNIDYTAKAIDTHHETLKDYRSQRDALKKELKELTK